MSDSFDLEASFALLVDQCGEIVLIGVADTEAGILELKRYTADVIGYNRDDLLVARNLCFTLGIEKPTRYLNDVPATQPLPLIRLDKRAKLWRELKAKWRPRLRVITGGSK